MIGLPLQSDASGLEARFPGVPLKVRPAYRLGSAEAPGIIRRQSAAIGTSHPAFGFSPAKNMTVADIGDLPVNGNRIEAALDGVTFACREITARGAVPLTLGGDLVGLAPQLDQGGTTAKIGAQLLFEMLCALPKTWNHPHLN